MDDDAELGKMMEFVIMKMWIVFITIQSLICLFVLQ